MVLQLFNKGPAGVEFLVQKFQDEHLQIYLGIDPQDLIRFKEYLRRTLAATSILVLPACTLGMILHRLTFEGGGELAFVLVGLEFPQLLLGLVGQIASLAIHRALITQAEAVPRLLFGAADAVLLGGRLLVGHAHILFLLGLFDGRRLLNRLSDALIGLGCQRNLFQIKRVAFGRYGALSTALL